ncbi:prolyl oligopeptidase family serine peptidase [Flavobacterium suncheonense]|uniref:Prolyl oligopeptidase n=1 Tax=Flavobacterium suncheonense GH29-5 = DSM 17707 TaxID=1121899 RepID=A0A0A2M8V0_9FLAO|nr:prolyl oligopeptidase family serine peptidase [Flavobacterium suncheonense]KGO89102.1 hypothetical protein Q764_09950 [Flavobacterium suncheonense GH29-5 = DSM 17707]
MTKSALALLFLFFAFFSFSQNTVPTKKIPETYKKHNTNITDDYAWLEKSETAEVKAWVTAQNELVEKHYVDVKKKHSSAYKIKEYDFYSSNPMPSQIGRYFYSLYRKDKATPASLFYRKTLNDSPVELFNPSRIYNNSNVFITDFFPSRHSKYVACEVNTNGSDKHEVKFVNITNNVALQETLTDVKYSDMNWNEDKGVFYTKNSNTRVFEIDSTFQLFYHEMGTSQIKDKLIFDATVSGNTFSYFTAENKLFIVENSKSEGKKIYHYASLTEPELKLQRFLEQESSAFHLLKIRKGKVYFSSGAYDWGEIRAFDFNDRSSETSVIPQIYTHLLVNSYFLDEYIVCKYKTIGKNYMIVYDYSGKFIRKFDIPYGMDFTMRFYDSTAKELFVSFFSHTIPYQNYRLNLENGEANHYFNDYIKPKPTIFPLNYFETKSITYKNRDNIDIPVTIIHKKGIALDGNNPTLLEAYGGFGMVSGPHYDTGLLHFLNKGGVYAFAEIRGGGERGKKWHTEGKGLKKINAFNDFIDAAEFLIREKYTSPNRLGISGGSHGGLVVGVAITQRPELFKVAIPIAGKYDMIKADLFTNGKINTAEYGSPDTPEGFEALLAYSPFHNIKETVNYPTTLIIAGDNDDRVTPFQSYKFAAKLQNREAQKNPVFLKTNQDAGHSGKVATYKDRIAEKAFFYDFLMYHLNQ